MTEKIEQLFKDALGNLEADVNPHVWTNIAQGLQVPVSVNHVAGNSSALKSAGILGKLGIKSVILISTMTVSVIGTTIYLVTRKADSKIEAKATTAQPVKENPVVVNSTLGILATNNEKISQPVNVTKGNSIAPETKKLDVVPEVKSNAEDLGMSGEKETALATPPAVPATPAKNSTPADNAALPGKSSSENTPQGNATNKESDKATGQAPGISKDENDPVFDTFDKYLANDDLNRQGLPNVFTPDGDGFNDVFTIKTTGLKTLEVIVFDKSGKKLYSWKSLDGEWNGKLPDGTEAPAGNYFYSVNAETLEGKICIAQSLLKLTR